jgi:toxin YoeB
VKIVFAQEAWEDYFYWQNTDKKILERINKLIKEATLSPFEGIGDPEPLKHNWSGFWSRRINKEHRLVYAFEKGSLLIAQCCYHY